MNPTIAAPITANGVKIGIKSASRFNFFNIFFTANPPILLKFSDCSKLFYVFFALGY
jgi:hypothetical protein